MNAPRPDTPCPVKCMGCEDWSPLTPALYCLHKDFKPGGPCPKKRKE